MKRSRIKPISEKHEIELAKRRLLKWELFKEQKGYCKDCDKHMSYYDKASDNFPHLSHKKPLSRGGKTDRDNCTVICTECHSNKEHHLRNKYGEQPRWTK